ncbi:MAG: ABC transporter permease [Candidatus Bathyarchaeia archaeon]
MALGFLHFLIRRAVTLAFVALLATSATLMLVGGFGIMDRLAIEGIRREARQEVILNPKLQGLPREEIERKIDELAYERILSAGLDRPFYQRIPKYLSQVITWDFGSAQFLTSDSGSTRVKDIILERLPRTALLFTTGSILSVLLGLAVGLSMGRRPGGLLDRSITGFAMVSYSLPLWWTGMLMILVFSAQLRILPPGGFVSIPPPEDPILYGLDVLRHMLLPLVTMLLVNFGGMAYITRNIIVGIFQQDYIFTARARGIPERIVAYRHALRAASPPIVTIAGFSIVFSIFGAIISETVFNWKGMGLLFWEAINMQDVPVILGLTYVSIFLYILLIFILDLTYAFLDPRVRAAMG